MKNEGEDTFVKVAVFFIAKEKKRPGKKKKKASSRGPHSTLAAHSKNAKIAW